MKIGRIFLWDQRILQNILLITWVYWVGGSNLSGPGKIRKNILLFLSNDIFTDSLQKDFLILKILWFDVQLSPANIWHDPGPHSFPFSF